MPVIVKIKNPYDGALMCVYVYASMKACALHSRGLISYYDLKRREPKYSTYKRHFECKTLSAAEFKAYRDILHKR